jgi:hypothetical protein
MITGGCLCGAVRYQAEETPLFAVLCHCRNCQRTSGTGHVPVLGVARSSFSSRGETRDYTVRGGSGLASTRYFCPTCGSLLFGIADVAPDSVSIYVGSLDDPSVFHPDTVIFTRSRHTWDASAQILHEFAAMPDQATGDA